MRSPRVKPQRPDNAKVRRALAAALKRSPAELVPPAFAFLWDTKRFIVAYGGRASAKSWSVARVLLTRGHDRKHLILCARESQTSIKESAYRLLCNQIRDLGLDDFYTIGADKITGRNGTEIIFEGLFRNAERLKSYEDISLCWVEEAHRVSERSWEDLIPTVRRAGSQIYITFNPSQADDPVWQRFVASMRPDVVARRVSWRDNPFLSAESAIEKDWCAKTDIDQYNYVWEGEFRTVTEAQILRGKYVVDAFETDSTWSGPFYGLDFGFSQDPTAGTVCYIDDESRTLYVAKEFWRLGADIDILPAALEAALPGVSDHTLYCDSARPETVSYLSRNGIPGARSAEKWNGSITDGIAYLRSFSKIVIHSDCQHVIDEANRYSYRVDRLTGNPLAEPEDRHNHLIDSMRYGLSPLIRNKVAGGSYFNRNALLIDGAPLKFPWRRQENGPTRIAVIAAVSDQPGAALGMLHVAFNRVIGWPLIVLDWALTEFCDVSEFTLVSAFNTSQELALALHAENPVIEIFAEDPLWSALRAVGAGLVGGGAGWPWAITRLDAPDLPKTIDERAAAVRELVNLGLSVKLSARAYERHSVFRSITGNHLEAQLLGYRPGHPEVEQSLLAGFVTAASICLLDSPRQRNQDAGDRPTVTPTAQVGERRARAIAVYEAELEAWQRDYQIELERQRKIGRDPTWTPPGGKLRGFRPRPQDPRSTLRWL